MFSVLWKYSLAPTPRVRHVGGRGKMWKETYGQCLVYLIEVVNSMLPSVGVESKLTGIIHEVLCDLTKSAALFSEVDDNTATSILRLLDGLLYPIN